MKLFTIGWQMLLWASATAVLSVFPAVLLAVLPPDLSIGLLGAFALMLTLTVTPIALLIASAGAILLLIALLRRGRG
jgi:hypothetical protein